MLAEGAAPSTLLSEEVLSPRVVVPPAPDWDAAVVSHAFMWPTDSEKIPAEGSSSATDDATATGWVFSGTEGDMLTSGSVLLGVRPGKRAVTSSVAVGDTVPMMATATGFLLPGAERATMVASLVPGSASPATGVGNPRSSPVTLFPRVGEAMSLSTSMSMSTVGSAVR